MTTMTVDVDIDPWEVVDDLPEEQLAEYLRECGYTVVEGPHMPDKLDKFEVQFLLGVLDTTSWEQRRIYDKLMKVRTD